MEIKYSRKQIKIGLIIGSALVVLNVANLIIYRSEVSFSLAVGLFLVGVSVYKHYRPYAVVKDGYFKKDLGAKILLQEIIETRRFAGDYVFRSRYKKITIDKNAVDKTSIDALETLIDELRDGKFKRI